MPRLFATIVIVTGVLTPCHAQEPDDLEARRVEARKARAELAGLVDALPAAEPPRRGQLPIPRLEILRLTRRLADHVTRYAEIRDEAGEALRLLARAHLAHGDAAAGIAALHRAHAHFDAGPLRRRVLAETAALRETWGDMPGAVVVYKKLIEENPDDPDVADWTKRSARAEGLARRQAAEIQRVEGMLKAKGKTRLGGAELARRFTGTYPMHGRSAALTWSVVEGADEKADPAWRLAVLEPMAFYAPRFKESIQVSRDLVTHLARECEYEKALLHAQRLLARSEDLPPGEATRLSAVARGITSALERALAREIPVRRKTKSVRYRDLVRRADYEDAQTFADMTADFTADYPTCSEVAHVELLGGRAALRHDAESGVRRLTALAEKFSTSRHALPAVLAAARSVEKTDGPEAAAELLGRHAGIAKPEQVVSFALERSRLLEKAQRWEEARALLEPLADTAREPHEKQRLDAALARLAKEIGDG